MQRLVFVTLWAATALIGPAQAASAAPAPDGGSQANCATFPFSLQLDMDVVLRLSRTPPERLLATLRRLGIDVLRVPASGGARTANPLLAPLPAAGRQLLERAGFLDSYEGRSIPRGDPCCGLRRDTALIREDAPTYTLLHEVLHLLLVPSDGQALRSDIELRFSTALRRLVLYQRRLMDDVWRLLQPQWRNDILSAQHEVAGLLYDRIRIGQSQETIVEQVLGACIDERNPYFDVERRAEGQRYGMAMLNNAVDMFNTVHDSLVFNDQAVQHLRAEIAANRLEPPAEPARLTAEDARHFAQATQAIGVSLERVRQEIEALKKHYGH